MHIQAFFSSRTDIWIFDMAQAEIPYLCIDEATAQVGLHVWAKFSNWVEWPSVIGECNEQGELLGQYKRGEGENLQIFVFFYNDYTHAWVPIQNVRIFCPETKPEEYTDKVLQCAVQELLFRMDEILEPETNRTIRKDDLVLAKFANYPPWPALVKPDDSGLWEKNGMYHVEELISESTFWAKRADIWKYSIVQADKTKVKARSKIHTEYAAAINRAEELSKSNKPSRRVPKRERELVQRSSY